MTTTEALSLVLIVVALGSMSLHVIFVIIEAVYRTRYDELEYRILCVAFRILCVALFAWFLVFVTGARL